MNIINNYQSHELNIAMNTSSGDTIEMDFSNTSSSSFKQYKDGNSITTSMQFSSMQAFHFKIETNGIDAQDIKEIESFMKIAQPYIDDFLKELRDATPKSPLTKLAHKIAAIFEPNKLRDEEHIKHIKTNIVAMFDKAFHSLDIPKELSTQEMIENILFDAQKLLEKTLKEFDEFNKNIYA